MLTAFTKFAKIGYFCPVDYPLIKLRLQQLLWEIPFILTGDNKVAQGN